MNKYFVDPHSVMPDKCVKGALADLPTEPLTYGSTQHSILARVIFPVLGSFVWPLNLNPD